VIQLGRVTEVRGHETGLTARGDRVDHRGATVVVPSVHDELGAVPAEFLGRCPADARRGPGNQGNDALEVSLIVHSSGVHRGVPSWSCVVAILRSKAAAGVSVTSLHMSAGGYPEHDRTGGDVQSGTPKRATIGRSGRRT